MTVARESRKSPDGEVYREFVFPAVKIRLLLKTGRALRFSNFQAPFLWNYLISGDE
jgi:hypothetical protein